MVAHGGGGDERLRGAGGGSGWLQKSPETAEKATRKFIAMGGEHCRVISEGVLGKFLKVLLVQLRQSMSWIL